MENKLDTLSDLPDNTFHARHAIDLKSRLSAIYKQHVLRYCDWNERDYRLKVWMITLTVVVILAAVGALLGRDYYLGQQQQILVDQAHKLMAKGNYSGAIASATKALNINSEDLEATRVMADASAMGHLRTELFWAQRLDKLEPTVENELRLAETGLRCQTAPFPISSGVLANLTGKCSNNPVFYLLAGKLAENQQRLNLAEANFKTAVQLDPGNQTYTLCLAMAQLKDSDPTVKEQARQQLEKLGQDGSLGGETYRALLAERVAAGDDAGAIHYSDLLVASPQATMAERLQGLEILHRLNPEGFSLRLLETMNTAANNAGTVLELSNWMQKSGLAKENMDWLNKLPYDIRSQPAYKMAMAQGYAEMGKWQALLDLVSPDNWHDMEYLRLALVSHAWAELGVPTLAQSDWGDAEMRAANHYEAMTNLLGLAEVWQLTDAQLELRHRLLEMAPQ